jgi:dihydrofolate synthase/folylpolyglutamate synthase
MNLAVRRSKARFNRLADWLAWQEKLHVKEIDLGLSRCRRVATRLAIGKPNYLVISVAGTNGKGSSVEMLGSILKAAGYRVALYTSPHLLRYNERVRIDGNPVEDAALCDAFERIDAVRGTTSLTYFEFGTLAALDIFQRSGIDIAVLEVGLGGRLDAVNLLDADVALITSIDIDHIDWLGASRESIGREKAGICRPGRPVVVSDPEAPRSIVGYAAEIGAKAQLLGRDFEYQTGAEGWAWRSGTTGFSSLPNPALQGDFQLQNAAGVLMVLTALADRLSVDQKAIAKGLSNVVLPGRLQALPGPVSHLLDVAHNAESARELAAWLEAHPIAGRQHFVVGMLKDKDSRSLFECLHALADAWYLATLASSRGADAQSLIAALPNGIEAQCFSSVAEALRGARQNAAPGDRIIVTGSFLTVADALRASGGRE